MLNNLKNISSAKALEEHLKMPNYQQQTVINQDKQTEIISKMSKDSTKQFWIMFIVTVLAIIVAIVK